MRCCLDHDVLSSARDGGTGRVRPQFRVFIASLPGVALLRISALESPAKSSTSVSFDNPLCTHGIIATRPKMATAAPNTMDGIVNSWEVSAPLLYFAAHNNCFDVQRRNTKELPLVEIYCSMYESYRVLGGGKIRDLSIVPGHPVRGQSQLEVARHVLGS